MATVAWPAARSLPAARTPRQRHWWRSTSARFAALYFALTLVCTLPVLYYVYREVDAILLADFTRPLEFRLSNLEKPYHRGGIPKLRDAVASRAERAHRDKTAILLVDTVGRKLAGNLQAWPANFAPPKGWVPLTLHRDGVSHDEQFLVRAVTLPSGHRLLLGGLLDNRAEMHAALLPAMAAAVALAVPLGLLGSLAMVREMNRMVVAIADVGQQVGAGDLQRRVPTDGSDDPVDQLKGAMNATLDRVAALVEEHRVLTDALAHDLRSPLSRIHMQVAAASAEAVGKDAARWAAISHELDGVLHMIESALEISRAEAGIGRGQFEPVDLAAICRDLHEIFRPLAASAGVALALGCDPYLVVEGNRALLARALSNLIDNALKYGRAGGHVLLEARQRGDLIELAVADRAGGIDPVRRQDALRKFGRLCDARSSPGNGLGLALVGAVASLHRGAFELQDNGPGLRAVIRLPLGG